jgi:predicted Fe-Mo cluster-binding NifX family protein
MRIAVAADHAALDAPTSPIFGRAPAFVFVDVDTMHYDAVENPALSAGGGAGVQAAQRVIELEVGAVITGNVGPNAFGVFQAAQIPVYLFYDGTVRQAVEAYRAGELPAVHQPTTAAHAGMGRGRGMGRRGTR